MKTISPFPVRVLYVYAIVIVGIILIPVVWFGFHYLFWEIQPVAQSISESLGTNSTEYYQVDTFFQAVDEWALLLGLLSLSVWAYVYSQRRGREIP